MATLVGIDEAGYGPLLGPLVVSAVSFDMPENLLRSDHWDILTKAVSTQKKGLAGRLLITDSKKAYSRKSGIEHLRRTVLSALHAWQNGSTQTDTIGDVLSLVCPDTLERIDSYPWYKEVNDHSLEHNVSDIAIAGGVLGKTMSEHNIQISGIQSKCLDVEHYNMRVKKVKNKSRVLFTELCALILKAFERNTAQTEPMQVIVDRQGGRINYQQELLRMFPAFSLSVIRQEVKMSSYELNRNGQIMRIHFCAKADKKYLVVSLASMVSKYLREVMMQSLNHYFCGLYPPLRPTAGYWQDGQRFVSDLAAYLPSHLNNREKLVRIL